MYLTLGFVPTLLGFAVGLLFQGLLFEPWDLPHLAVNSLSLTIPLIAVYFALGRKLRDQAGGPMIGWSGILKLDPMYYSGVAVMVGFWLMVGEVAAPFGAWAAFAGSYLAVVAVELLFAYATLSLLKRYEHTPFVATCFDVQPIAVK